MKRNLTMMGWSAIAVALLALSSCTQSPTVSASPSEDAAEIVKPGQQRESWDICLLQGTRVGYGHTTMRDVGSGRVVLSTENISHVALRRGADPTRQTVRTASLETPDGRLLSFESDNNMDVKPIHVTGKVDGDRIDVEINVEGNPSKTISIAWPTDGGGPFAVEHSLLRKPMQPGQQRKIKMLAAEFLQVADVEITAKDYESVRLPGGAQDLLRIDTVTRLADNQKIEQTVWTDRTGDMLKTHTQAFGGFDTYRVTKADALKNINPAASVDLLSSMKVKIEPPPADLHRAKEARYQIHLDGSDPAGAFTTGPTQAVKPIDANTADVTVYAIRPGQSDGNRNAPADPPTADDLKPNLWVQSDDPLIVANAKKAAGDEKDPWRVAVALEGFVNREITKKDFSQAFASASEVARSHEGDCTEHAVYLMALCRARGIPARAAIGLVYLPAQHAFFYHMWTEAYIDKRWIPIDATRAQGGIGAGHLKIAQSSLKDATAYSAFLPVIQVSGQLSIKIVSMK